MNKEENTMTNRPFGPKNYKQALAHAYSCTITPLFHGGAEDAYTDLDQYFKEAWSNRASRSALASDLYDLLYMAAESFRNIQNLSILDGREKAFNTLLKTFQAHAHGTHITDNKLFILQKSVDQLPWDLSRSDRDPACLRAWETQLKALHSVVVEMKNRSPYAIFGYTCQLQRAPSP